MIEGSSQKNGWKAKDWQLNEVFVCYITQSLSVQIHKESPVPTYGLHNISQQYLLQFHSGFYFSSAVSAKNWAKTQVRGQKMSTYCTQEIMKDSPLQHLLQLFAWQNCISFTDQTF